MIRTVTILVFTLFLAFPVLGQAKKNVKKVIRYKKEMTIDLSGTVIKSQAKSPDIFYIFRRKRSTGGNILSIPQKLDHHITPTVKMIKEIVK